MFWFSTSAWASVELNFRITPVMCVWQSEVSPENKVNQALCQQKRILECSFIFTEHTSSESRLFPERHQEMTKKLLLPHRPCFNGKPHVAHPHQRATLTICSQGLTPNVCHHQFWQTWPRQGGTRNDDTDRPVEHSVLLMQAKGHRLLRGPSVSEGSGERSSMLNYSRALSVFCCVCGCVYPQ